MKILYVSADSYYDAADRIFSKDESPENLVVFNHYLLSLVASEGGRIDVYPEISDGNYDFIIFNDFPLPNSAKEKFLRDQLNKKLSKIILILMETPVIRPDYSKLYDDDDALSQFDTVFTWNDELLKKENVRKFNFTIKLTKDFQVGLREHTVTCIAAKKRVKHERACYHFREKGIKALSNSKMNFSLYGKNWNRIKLNSGGVNSILNRIFSLGPTVSAGRYSWRGPIACKSEVLRKSAFNLVVENAVGYSGYITEKILHSFVYGSIPIYYGAKEAKQLFRNSGVIFIEDYGSWEELIHSLSSLSSKDIINSQSKMAAFLSSREAEQFDANKQAHQFYRQLKEQL